MFKTIDIQNYRNLPEITLTGLSRVNLFIGDDTSRKSSVLEAIEILATIGSPTVLANILSKHVLVDPEAPLELISHLFSDCCSDNKIHIGGNRVYKEGIENFRYVDLALLSSETPYFSEHNNMISYQKELFKVSFPSLFNEELTKTYIYKEENPSDFMRYSSVTDALVSSIKVIPFGLIPLKHLIESYDNIAFTDKEDILIQALQIIEPKIKQVNFIKHRNEDVVLVKLSGIEKPVPIQSLSNGVQRLFQLILFLLNVEEDGFLLIEEFENGFHYLVLQKIWRLVNKLAEQFKIQIFVNTNRDTEDFFGDDPFEEDISLHCFYSNEKYAHIK